MSGAVPDSRVANLLCGGGDARWNYAVRPASGAAPAKVKVFVQLLRECFGQPPFWDLVYESGPRPAATAGLRLVT